MALSDNAKIKLRQLMGATEGESLIDNVGDALVADTADITDLAVTTAKLDDEAVTTAKLDDGAVTLAKMAVDSVDTDQLVADSVTSAKIDDGAVVTAALADDGVTVGKLGLGCLVSEQLGAPSLADDDYYVVTVAMQATAYTLAQTAPAAGNPPRNITVTHATVDTTDTLGNLVVVGTNVNDVAINETIAVATDGVATGTKAFKTITSMTTAGWVIGGGTADNIKIGFGTLQGLSRCYASANSIVACLLNKAVVAGTVAVDSDEPEKNTVDTSASTYDGTKRSSVLTVIDTAL